MKHIQHLEELVFSAEGRILLQGLLHSIRYREPKGYTLCSTVKYDGAPAIVFGKDMEGKPFVSTKSFYNKSPIICYTEQDIYQYFQIPNVISILHTALTAIDFDCIPTGQVYQGDVLYCPSTMKLRIREGAQSLTCPSVVDMLVTACPNVVEYVIPELKQDDLVLAVHTQFDFDNVDGSTYVWPQLDLGPFVYVAPNEAQIYNAHEIFDVAVRDTLYSHSLRVYTETESKFIAECAEYMRIVDNIIVRNEDAVHKQRSYGFLLGACLARRISTAYSTAKTNKGIEKASELVALLQKCPEMDSMLTDLYEYRQALAKFKLELLFMYMDSAPKLDVYNCEHEGAVCYIEHPLQGEFITKLVNRNEFSRLNFRKNGGEFHMDDDD